MTNFFLHLITKKAKVFFAFLIPVLILSGCFVGTPDTTLPQREELIGAQSDNWSRVPALRRIPVSSDLFLSRSLRPPVPADVGERKINLHFPTGSATLSDFAGIMDLQEISVVLKPAHIGGASTQTQGQAGGGAANNSTSDLEAKRLPFRRFSGTVSELINKLNRSMDVVAWWEAGALFISDRDQYVVSLPQHKDVIEAVAKELQSFGAEGITTSLYGGRIVYTARPQLNENVIKPYFKSMSGNLSEITLQIAVISLTLNELSERGFDWSSFGAQVGDPAKAATGSILNNPTLGTIGAVSGISGSIDSTSRPAGSGKINVGLIDHFFGSGQNLYGINAAILYLSQFGKTKTKQMVELRTLAGMPVQLRSGQEIPYVKSIASTTTPGGATAGNVSSSVQTETVSTGLTLKATPYFDSLMELVVIDVSIEVAAVPEFRVLNTGEVSGEGDEAVPNTISQPVKEERSLNDIVRIRAGETVILGGIREENQSDNRTAPYGLFDGAGSKAEKDQTILNFFIMRPVVTFYEPVSASDTKATEIKEAPAAPPANASLTGVLPVVPSNPSPVSETYPVQALPPVSVPVSAPVAKITPPENNDSAVQDENLSEDDFSGHSNMFGRTLADPDLPEDNDAP